MAVERGSRISCRIPCDLVQGRRKTSATVVDLSESGIGVETELAINSGDTVTIRLFPKRRHGTVELVGIAWNRRKRAGGRRAVAVVGFMVSDPPQAYLDLIERQSGRDEESQRLARLQRLVPSPSGAAEAKQEEVSTPQMPPAPPPPAGVESPDESLEVVAEPAQDSALPRPKYPLPPPKASAEETLPGFRVRVKQTSGPRTRRLTVQAQSEQDAASRATLELGEGWEILEISPITKPEPAV